MNTWGIASTRGGGVDGRPPGTRIVVRLPLYGARLHLLRTPLVRTADPERAKRSRFAWAIDGEHVAGDGPVRITTVYTLTPLGILHGLIGLTVDARMGGEPR